MAFQILSGGLVTTGTTGADLFIVDSGSLSSTTILGKGGNDTIQAQDAGNNGSGTAVLFDGGGNLDVIQLSGLTLLNSTLQGGAGADNISGAAHIFSGSFVKGGDGNDTINLLSGGAIGGSTVHGGNGADSVTISDNLLYSAEMGMGAGADTLLISNSGAMASANILGGGGGDSIVLSGHAAGGGSIISGEGLSINGDSNVNGGGADTIRFEGTLSGASTVRGKGGADTITINSGFAATGGQVLGNAGGDTIVIGSHVGGAVSGNYLIGGGQGNDSITFSGTTTGAMGLSIVGGGGVDSIVVDGGANGVAANVFSGQIIGGAGADLVDFATAAFGSGAFIQFDAASESNVSTTDTVDYRTGVTFTVSAALGNAVLSTGVAGGESFNGAITDGILSGTDFETAEALTARVATIDAAVTTKGAVFMFEDNSNNDFLFIQGGSSGTADDIVVQFSGVAGISQFRVGSGSVSMGNVAG